MSSPMVLSQRRIAGKVARLASMISLCGVCMTVLAAPQQQSVAPQADALQNLLDTSRKGLFSLLKGEVEPALIERTKEAACQAMTLIEAGQLTISRQQQDDAMGWLHFTLGAVSLREKEYVDAARHLRLVAMFDGGARRDPRAYRLLGLAYEDEYRKLTERYYSGPQTVEMMARLKLVDRIIDLMIDAYSRAVALYGAEPGWQQEKLETRSKLEECYKYRRGGSAAGLDEFIKESLSRPLPAP